MTWDFLMFGVFCLFVIGYLVWDRAHRKYPEEFKLNHPMYDLREKTKEEIVEE